jgi:putative salt-induced outer membrane protein YdiY
VLTDLIPVVKNPRHVTSFAIRCGGGVFLAAFAARGYAQATPPKTAFTGDFGFVSATGNTQLNTISLGEKLVRTDGRWTLAQLASFVRGETDRVETANQLRVAGRADAAFHPRLSAFAGVSFERNTFAGIKRRTDEIAGVRWKAIVATRDSMSIDGGGVATQASNVDGTKRHYPSARVAGAYKHVFTKSAYFAQLAEYVPNLQTSGAYRATSESSLVAPLSAHVGIKASYVIQYDSRPPAGFGTTDRLFTTGIQIAY